MSVPPTKRFIGYVLLTHGRRHTSAPLHERPGAKGQMLAHASHVRWQGASVANWVTDYCRSPRNAASFPRLLGILAEAEAAPGSIVVLVDRLERLFHPLAPEERVSLSAFLHERGAALFDISRLKAAADLNTSDWRPLVLSGLPTGQLKVQRAKPPPRAMDTQKAVDVSRKARGHIADRHAGPIGLLHDEIVAKGEAFSMAALARLANERGLKTSRGKPWTDTAVRRALERLGRR